MSNRGPTNDGVSRTSRGYAYLGVFAGFGIAALTQLVFNHAGLSMALLVAAPIILGAAAGTLGQEVADAQ